VGVGQHAQDREQVLPALGLVDDDGAVERGQREGGVAQAGVVTWVLEVEVVARGRVDHVTGQRGLARLSRPGEQYNRGARQGVLELLPSALPVNHMENLTSNVGKAR
jgi:hypothetical protein